MKITVALVLLVAVSDAASPGSKSREKIQEKPEKRGLVEGNAGVEKRAPVLPTVSPAGVEYAETKQNLPDKSPSQNEKEYGLENGPTTSGQEQIYATPVPQISKISDFLSAPGQPFQAAIANHLYSPFSVYNPRYEAPTTYEVSAPVPSQLAYTEHRLSMPSSNSLQYSPKPQKLAKPIDYPQPKVVTQQSYKQQNLGYAPLLQQIPNNGIPNFQAIQYNQASQGYIEQQQLQYIHDSSNQLIPSNIQQHPVQNKNQHIEQRDLKSQPASTQVLEKQNVQQAYFDKQQPAQSFARFIYNPPLEAPANAYDQYKNQQLHTQSQHSQPHPQLQIQPQYQSQHTIQSQQYQASSQPLAQIQYHLQHPSQLPQIPYQAPQELQYQLPQQIQYQPQPQIQYQEEQPQFYQQIQSQFLQPQALAQPHAQAPQYQIQAQNYQLQQTQPQYFEKSEPIAQYNKQPVVSEKQYFKQNPIQPQLSQQIFPQQQIQNLAYKQPPATPTFPPVQYFGKFAQSIFSNPQH